MGINQVFKALQQVPHGAGSQPPASFDPISSLGFLLKVFLRVFLAWKSPGQGEEGTQPAQQLSPAARQTESPSDMGKEGENRARRLLRVLPAGL